MGSAGMERGAACWCGDRNLQPFSPEYARCAGCGTLVPPAGAPAARDGDLFRRTRTDLPEVAMRWLQTLLRYKLPPARVLVVGGTGGFTALLRWAGYDASGLAPGALAGASHVPEVSLDVIVLDHVVEQLADPVAAVGAAARWLKPDGVLVVQVPSVPEGANYDQMRERGDHFLTHLNEKSERRLNLFGQRAARLLFGRLGFLALDFVRARFDPYDLALVTSRQPLVRHGYEVLAQAMTTPEQQMKLAWFELLGRLDTLEVDRAARLEVIRNLEAACVERLALIQRLDADLRQALADAATNRAERDALAAALRDAQRAAAPAKPRSLLDLPRRALRRLKRLVRPAPAVSRHGGER